MNNKTNRPHSNKRDPADNHAPPVHRDVDSALQDEIERMKRDGRYRQLRKIVGPIDTTVTIDGKKVILLSSNNYLGLANHSELKAAATLAIQNYGTGTGASRLISGNMAIHEVLEAKIADFKGSQAALVFPTGYMANIGLISALADKNDLIFSDELNHASIIDGCRLSEANVCVYPHKNMAALARLLQRSRDQKHHAPVKRIIITDGIFSMNGDITPLPDIIDVARAHQALVIVDDAHATGVLGPRGRGTAEHFGIEGHMLIQVGTLSKALGGLGGFVAGSAMLMDWLRNTSRSFIYSTAPPPSVCATAIAAMDLLDKDSSFRRRLWDNVATIRHGLDNLGFDTMGSRTPIIPVLIGDAARAMGFARYLLDKGIYAPGIRPPTVSKGQCRIRLSLMASHTSAQCEHVLAVCEQAGREFNII